MMEEDFYVVLLYATASYLPGTTFWSADRTYSFRAEKGKLDAQTNLLNTVAHSVRLMPDWAAGYLYVVQLFQQRQYAAIANAGAISNTIARNSEEIRQIYRAAWDRQQATYDRIFTSYSQTIRGVATYGSPYVNHAVVLPSGYSNVWASANGGGYLLSNIPGFDPNRNSIVNWVPLQIRR